MGRNREILLGIAGTAVILSLIVLTGIATGSITFCDRSGGDFIRGYGDPQVESYPAERQFLGTDASICQNFDDAELCGP